MSGRRSKQRALVGSLLEQARREVWSGWLSDLVLPLVSEDAGSQAPPPPTQPPRELADADSEFAEVDGVSLHFKQCWPSTGEGPASGASSAAQQQRPAVLLIHGFNGSVFNWRDTMQAVADETGCRSGISCDSSRPPHCLLLCFSLV